MFDQWSRDFLIKFWQLWYLGSFFKYGCTHHLWYFAVFMNIEYQKLTYKIMILNYKKQLKLIVLKNH